MQWSPTGPNTKNPNSPSFLATASLDHTVKLWEMEKGRCVQTFSSHQ